MENTPDATTRRPDSAPPSPTADDEQASDCAKRHAPPASHPGTGACSSRDSAARPRPSPSCSSSRYASTAPTPTPSARPPSPTPDATTPDPSATRTCPAYAEGETPRPPDSRDQQRHQSHPPPRAGSGIARYAIRQPDRAGHARAPTSPDETRRRRPHGERRGPEGREGHQRPPTAPPVALWPVLGPDTAGRRVPSGGRAVRPPTAQTPTRTTRAHPLRQPRRRTALCVMTVGCVMTVATVAAPADLFCCGGYGDPVPLPPFLLGTTLARFSRTVTVTSHCETYVCPPGETP